MLPVIVSPEGSGFRVKVVDGSDGLAHSGGVYCPDNVTALVCVADLLGVETAKQIDSPVLAAMREVLNRVGA
jgi:hypothetical protein